MTETLAPTESPELAEPVGARRGGSADPTVRQRLHRIRWQLAAGLVLVLACAGLAIYGSTAPSGTLDPRSYDPGGTHALTVLLGQRGVAVTTDTDVSAAIDAAVAGSTLVVVRPDYLNTDQLRQIAATGADLVIADADQPTLDALSSITGDLQAADVGDTATRQPFCSLPVAVTAGPARLGDVVYTGGSGVHCYPSDDGYGLVSFTQGGRQVSFLGDNAPLVNSALADDGDAALALGLLDAHPHLTWLLPLSVSPASSASGQRDLTSLLPLRLKSALIQLAIAVLIVALWRGRRFGRLVREGLPVVVRRAEVVVGRARLYQRSRARDTAAEALRAGSRDRLGHRLGFGAHPVPGALVDAVATRAYRPPTDIGALLYGATPADDHALVALAQALSVLEQEVSRT